MIISVFRQGSDILREPTAQGQAAGYTADANHLSQLLRCLPVQTRGNKKKGSQISTVLQKQSSTNTPFHEVEGHKDLFSQITT